MVPRHRRIAEARPRSREHLRCQCTQQVLEQWEGDVVGAALAAGESLGWVVSQATQHSAQEQGICHVLGTGVSRHHLCVGNIDLRQRQGVVATVAAGA